MNYDEIISYLTSHGYRVSMGKDAMERAYLEVACDINGSSLKLRHYCIAELISLPKYHLLSPKEHDRIAHVSMIEDDTLGDICIGDKDSISVNFEQPELAFEESLKRHISLLEKAITDRHWNEQELLREFYATWLQVCEDGTNLLCAASGNIEEISVFSPVPNRFGYKSQHLGITESFKELSEFSYLARQAEGRTLAGAGVVVPLKQLLPAPASKSEIVEWYLQAMLNATLPETIRHKKDRNFWIVFNADSPSGRTWFGIHLKYKGDGKKVLPITVEKIHNWLVTPIQVTVFNKDRLMPRSGANRDLENKRVLIVGCGSVGGEIAYKLGAAGVGTLMLCDPDIYSVNNIYRHVLSDLYIYSYKSHALKLELESKYPWLKVIAEKWTLLDLRNKKLLECFDLIVIAIGSPTHERIFHDFLIENGVRTPVINIWLEGYGIGGHAVLDIRNSKGCLRCAYVDQSTGARGLASNLNFLEPNQDLTINHAGCGDLFLPYDAISAAQTALIGSNLSVGYLLGKIKFSAKTSWKGDDAIIKSKGFAVTHRYTVFDKSLQILPLYNEDCDLCNE